MFQSILLMAILGLVVAYVLRPTVTEGFHSADDGLVEIDRSNIANPPNQGKGSLADYAHLTQPEAQGDLTNRDKLTTMAGPPGTPHKNPTAWVSDGTEDDPRDLPWIASWTPADQAARRGQNCAPLYTEAGPDGTTIVTVSKSCEAGMAHTRAGDRIVLPDSIPPPHRGPTIQHELVHIYQRREPSAWATFFQRNWSFILYDAPPASMPSSLTLARRSNPDCWSTWPCWQGRYWPLAVYKNPKTPHLRDAVTVWWDDFRREVLTIPPPAWSAFFGAPSQDEHPNEMSAVMIVGEDTQTEAGRRLWNWWRLKHPNWHEPKTSAHTLE
jgi:hypothetical protein